MKLLSKAGKRLKAKSKVETTKKALWFCLIQGCVWVWCSYILAFLGKEQIAETLSSVAVTEIIGVTVAYCAKSAIENLSKNNAWPDKAERIVVSDEGPDKEREEPPDIGE